MFASSSAAADPLLADALARGYARIEKSKTPSVPAHKKNTRHYRQRHGRGDRNTKVLDPVRRCIAPPSTDPTLPAGVIVTKRA